MLVVDETKADLVALILADFGALRPGADLNRDLVDWLHYRARCVVGRPRQVVRSNEVEAHRAAYPAIDEIAGRLVLGLDVSPWLSDSIRREGNDPKADPMFNRWQVSHLHLGPCLDNPRRVKPSGPLLFAHIGADRAILLDVRPESGPVPGVRSPRGGRRGRPFQFRLSRSGLPTVISLAHIIARAFSRIAL